MNKNLKQIYLISLIFIPIFFFLGLSLMMPKTVFADYPTGNLSVENDTVKLGKPIKITIDGYDKEGLIGFKLFHHGTWSIVYVNAISTSRNFSLFEDYPGIYKYCGQVIGKTLSGNYEFAPTSPNCVTVTVTPYDYDYDEDEDNDDEEDDYHYKLKCYNDDLYWYSRWNDRQEKYKDCGSDSTTSWEYYCSGNSVYRKRTKYERGCSSNKCYTNSKTEKEFVKDCSSNETCQSGKCVAKNTPTPQPNQCTTGMCCQDNKFKPSSSICNIETKTEYGCPWGTAKGADVGKRIGTRLQYCSGTSASCTGSFSQWTWTNWSVADYCSENEICVPGKEQCQKVQTTSYTPVITQVTSNYIKYFKKDCYENNLYWFDSNNNRQELIEKCSENTQCSLDGCKEIEKKNDLIITALGNKNNDTNKLLKTINLSSGEKINIIFIVKNNTENEIKNIAVNAEIPDDITNIRNLKIDGKSVKGDIKEGINISSLDKNSTKTISFEGKLEKAEEEKEIEIIGKVKSENYSNSDSLKVNINLSQNIAVLGLAAIKFAVGKWYFWLILIIFLAYLCYVIFRKLFSVMAN